MMEGKFGNSFMLHKIQNIYTVNIEKRTQTVSIRVCVNSGNGLVMISWFGIFMSEVQRLGATVSELNE